MDDLKKRLDAMEQFLNPDLARFRLVVASLYIATYEALRSTVIDRLKSFFADRWTEAGVLESDEYKKKVLALHKKRTTASLMFWRDGFNVITDDDIKAFERITDCRNDLAHRMLTILVSDGLPPNLDTIYVEMNALRRKIECWWLTNVEAGINPNIPADADLTQARSGEEMILNTLIAITLGAPREAHDWLNGFRKASAKAGLA